MANSGQLWMIMAENGKWWLLHDWFQWFMVGDISWPWVSLLQFTLLCLTCISVCVSTVQWSIVIDNSWLWLIVVWVGNCWYMHWYVWIWFNYSYSWSDWVGLNHMVHDSPQWVTVIVGYPQEFKFYGSMACSFHEESLSLLEFRPWDFNLFGLVELFCLFNNVFCFFLS